PVGHAPREDDLTGPRDDGDARPNPVRGAGGLMTARITVLAGHSGSGKTEIAVNRAIRLAREGGRAALVDLDTVNHYFRTRIVYEQLKAEGVRVVLPPAGLQNVDIPIVSPEVFAVFHDPTWQVFVDLGGDAVGSRVLGQFAEGLEGKAEMLLVVNPFRPRTASAEKALTEAADILATAHLNWTGVLANPNLGPETTAADVLEGVEGARECAWALGVPLVGVAVRRDLAAAVAEGLPGVAIEPLDIYLDRTVQVEHMGGRLHGSRSDQRRIV
ncbi:MAG TPA: hypothetical protein VD973_09060, partial [Symbiobacteriaceae bacterium]|nr:hypothetical protein [Symbiobacteriaceae bacterium]